jgi:hypothetical protein
MDEIAIRLGWIAINASRVEVLLGYLQAALGLDEAKVVGLSWRASYDSCRSLYRDLVSQAQEQGDEPEASRCELFLAFLSELHSWMQDRHHVLHAIWEQDLSTELGGTLLLRRHIQRVHGQWPVDRLDALNRYLVDAHGLLLTELEYQLTRQQ